MLILGIDTSGRQGSVALLRAQGGNSLPSNSNRSPAANIPRRLLPTIAGLLVRHGLERSAIGLIAVASGPGSFTGLRVAIATVKGLAEAFATPVVAVSVLEAIALVSAAQGKVIAAMDAQRSEVFSGEYIVESACPEACRMQREAIASFADFTRMLASGDPAMKIYTPDDGLCVRLREAGFDAHLLARPSAEAFAAHRPPQVPRGRSRRRCHS